MKINQQNNPQSSPEWGPLHIYVIMGADRRLHHIIAMDAMEAALSVSNDDTIGEPISITKGPPLVEPSNSLYSVIPNE